MRVLAIETSCDETAVAILEGSGAFPALSFRILGNALLSQADKHAAFGGVFPNLAKREHTAAIVPLIEAALTQANLLVQESSDPNAYTEQFVSIFSHEPGLAEQMSLFLSRIARPQIDAIAVTAGPGLEPALWVGINAAKALGVVWDIPVIAQNHMEGHFLSSLLESNPSTPEISTLHKTTQLPVLGLLISGGHTEFVVMRQWLTYETIGQTVDDAVGEAFDKTARLLSLPYPGGPQISRLAEEARASDITSSFTLPRPMLKSGDLNFSFSGLKTAVLYAVQKIEAFTPQHAKELALEFENAVGDVVREKTRAALEKTAAKTFLIGGGVAANTHIRRILTTLIESEFPDVQLCLPNPKDTGDNAVMIAQAALMRLFAGHRAQQGDIRADGNLAL